MTTASQLFARYLEQRRELGDAELTLSPGVLEAIRLFDSTPARAPFEAAGTEFALEAPVPSAGLAEAGVLPMPLERLVSLDALDEVREVANGCTACGLAATRTTVVFGEGDPAARLMVVGEAPGGEEDRTGRPFVGRAGRLLDLLLLSVGFDRQSVYICNVLKCRPPKNRDPMPEEVEACSHFLRRQLDMVAPEAILAVGAFPARALLQSTESIGRLRGSVHELGGIPLVPTYHPAALLRNPTLIRPVWEDLQRLRTILDG